jgi:hypothetical protein
VKTAVGNVHIGSSVDSFFAEEGLLEEIETIAATRVIEIAPQKVNGSIAAVLSGKPVGECCMGIAKIVRKTTLHEANDDARDLAYWLSRPMAERIAAVDELRRPVIEALPLAEQRLQRVYRVTTLKQGKGG